MAAISERSREQGFRNARRHHGEVDCVHFRDTDEAVHDAPDRAEEADEGCGRPATRHLAAGRLLDALELPGDALLEVTTMHCIWQKVT